jgi:methyl-accepting chemotaxis protein
VNWFSNLRIGVRLAIAFAALGAALAVVAWVGASSVQSVSSDTKVVAERDTAAVGSIGTINDSFGEIDTLVPRHLYVYDGDLETQDKIQKQVEANVAEINKELTALKPRLESEEAAAALEKFTSLREAYFGEVEKDLGLSRQETIDQVEERDGSRNLYTEKVVADGVTVRASLAELGKTVTAQADATAASAADSASGSRRTVLLIAFLAIAFAAGLGFVITRSVIRPTRTLVDRLASIDENDLPSLNAGLAAIAEGDLTVTAEAVTEPIPNPTNDEIGAASKSLNGLIAKTGESLEAYNTTRAKLATTIGHVNASATAVGGASQQMAQVSEEAGRAVNEIAAAVGEVAEGAERQVQTVAQTRILTDQVGTATQASAASAQETAEVARGARELANEGVAQVTEATEAMQAVRDSSATITTAIQELGQKSEQIGGIVETITGIAGQTNLLALNAAIEAARAGEQGRGFAVVAEEVRKLAEESQTAASTISGLIEEIQSETASVVGKVEEGAQRTNDGAQTVEQAREAFLRIGEAVEDMHSRVEEIANAIGQIAESSSQMQSDIGEVAAVAEQSSAATEQVSASTQQTSASTQEIAASAQELAATAEQLERLVGEFKLAL